MFQLSVWLYAQVEKRGGVELPKDAVLLRASNELALLPVKEFDNISVWLNENGVRHRGDGPAIVHVGGGEEWYVHGELHRIGGPAVIYDSGVQQWYEHGQRVMMNTAKAAAPVFKMELFR